MEGRMRSDLPRSRGSFSGRDYRGSNPPTDAAFPRFSLLTRSGIEWDARIRVAHEFDDSGDLYITI